MNYERMYKELEQKITALGYNEEVTGTQVINFLNDVENTEKARQEVEEEPEQQAEPKKRVSHLELARQTRKI